MLVIFEPLGSTLGYHSTYKRVHAIHINQDLGSLEQRFVCAHELAHAILHPQVNTPFLRTSTLFTVGRIEREANTFAMYLLLANAEVIPDETIERLFIRTGVPYEMAPYYKKDGATI